MALRYNNYAYNNFDDTSMLDGYDLTPWQSKMQLSDIMGNGNNNNFSASNIWNSALGYNESGPNGQMIQHQGWLSPLANVGMGIWSAYNTNKANKKRLDLMEKEYGLKKDTLYDNLLMKMANYRDFRNNKALQEAQRRDYLSDGSYDMSDADRSKYLQDRVVYDASGNVIADPVNLSSFGSGQNMSNPNNWSPSQYPTTTNSGQSAFATNPAVTGQNPIEAAQANEALAYTTPAPNGAAQARKRAGLSNVNPNPQPNEKKKPKLV